MTEKQKFVERFDRAFNQEGLKDVKFFVRDGHTLTAEEFFAAANEFHAASAHGTVLSLAELDKALV